MKEIKLTQNKVALVDDEDFEYLNQWKWYAQKTPYTFYAKRGVYISKGRTIRILMHQAIMGNVTLGIMPDHKDGDGLNNQRANLRLVTKRQNCQNRHHVKYSQYPGVTFDKKRDTWLAHIKINGKTNHLGYYPVEKDAFDAYRQAVESVGETVVEAKTQ